MNFILWHKGKECGPYDADSLRNSIQSGDVSPQILARLEDGKDWKPLELLMPKEAPAPPPVVVSQEKQDAPAPVPVTTPPPKNPAARTLAYVLIATGLPLLGVGVVKLSPEKNSLESLNYQFATDSDSRTDDIERLARYTGKGFREIDASRDHANRLRDDGDRLKSDREKSAYLFIGLGVFVALAGLILRVLS